ncbi:MAG TPA: hypothetical protein VEC35_20955 [Noviherbaspirillum sp.]|nr:hypothetical protein [Noviherbaspirillum sp.]
MASIPLSVSAIDALKKEVRRFYDERKSSHLTEALASALGFNTHAALLTALKASGPEPLYCLLNEEKFDARMQAFGYLPDPEFIFEDAKTPEMIGTDCSYAYGIHYKTNRQKAWRNLMVSAVNEALRRRLFSLRPGDNRWPGHDDQYRTSYLFDFVLPCGLPARVALHDAGFDELSVHVAVNPKGDRVRFFESGLSAGDAFGATWLERQRGAWIQSVDDSFRCRRSIIDTLIDMKVEPLGYGDRGRLIM